VRRLREMSKYIVAVPAVYFDRFARSDDYKLKVTVRSAKSRLDALKQALPHVVRVLAEATNGTKFSILVGKVNDPSEFPGRMMPFQINHEGHLLLF
jgi:hypothetical protein